MYGGQLGYPGGVLPASGQQYNAPVEFTMNGAAYRIANGSFYRKSDFTGSWIPVVSASERVELANYYNTFVYRDLAVGLVPGYVNETINGVVYGYPEGQRPDNLSVPNSNNQPIPQSPKFELNSTTMLLGVGLIILLLAGGRR